MTRVHSTCLRSTIHVLAQIKTAWNKARQRAGVPELLVHDLRRTAARNMIRAGVPEKQVMLIAGWKTRSLLDRYNVVDERDVIAAGQKLDRYATELAGKVRTKFVQREEKGEPVKCVN